MGNFKFKSHKDEVLDELDNALEVALEEIGLTAEGFAKKKCPVDTGLLRNSITHALDGESTAISEYTDNLGKQSGSYSGAAPKEPEGKRTVYVGTNVEYAVYVEMGTANTKPQPYLRPAILEHTGTYKAIVKRVMKDT